MISTHQVPRASVPISMESSTDSLSRMCGSTHGENLLLSQIVKMLQAVIVERFAEAWSNLRPYLDTPAKSSLQIKGWSVCFCTWDNPSIGRQTVTVSQLS